ncbi:MAG: Diaminopimelate decarboxylase [Turneriella sp.]|nr:Diaminopimelate decarboxylase [Turneriella sp.]
MFDYKEERLIWHGVPVNPLITQVEDLLKKQFNYTGPFWLYSEKILTERLAILEKELPHFHFYYSVKSLPNIGILKRIQPNKNFGADVVSGGELYRALKAGFDPKRIVFAGVGKTEAEIEYGINEKIRAFHVESIAELKDIERIAEGKKTTAHIAFRLNPDVEVDTHKHITTGKEENKFGMSEADFLMGITILKKSKHLKLVGLQAHIGSQLFDATPYIKTAQYLHDKYAIIQKELSQKIDYVSLGGGFGVKYERLEGDGIDFDFSNLGASIGAIFKDANLEVHFEPGRFIAAPTGILMTRVRHLKERTGKVIAIIDAAMNDLIRPMLYEAYHPILSVNRREGEHVYDVVGPVCESTDTFATKRTLATLAENDWLAIGYAGAYGASMSSNFNSRVLLPELLLAANGELKFLRTPQTYDEMLANEFAAKN